MEKVMRSSEGRAVAILRAGRVLAQSRRLKYPTGVVSAVLAAVLVFAAATAVAEKKTTVEPAKSITIISALEEVKTEGGIVVKAHSVTAVPAAPDCSPAEPSPANGGTGVDLIVIADHKMGPLGLSFYHYSVEYWTGGTKFETNFTGLPSCLAEVSRSNLS
jgi:hypothetical protein